jgi:hypothetical protein
MNKSWEQQREDYIAINTGKASPELIKEWISEREGIIIFYREQMNISKDKKNYWKGKIGHKTKEINALKRMLNEG